ncbi:MAG: PqqD family peptide modification chaperone [Solirubrobacteraceae bacterium]
MSDGLVIGLGGDRAVHYLNNSAAAVFALCDGRSTVAEIAVRLGDAFGLSEAPGELVARCVADLRAKQVLI